jgi:hypothetical protein
VGGGWKGEKIGFKCHTETACICIFILSSAGLGL